ncbi:hypothetical protein [Marinobacter salarius]|uniref:hypothetical protein n=1 Tax=Marinobacter salarius TaxID=1420917 RepID=UPI003BACF7F8
MFNYALQSNVRATTAQPVKAESFKAFYEATLAKKYTLENKDDAPVFIPVMLSRPVRNDDAVLCITAVVVDVDNDNDQLTGKWMEFPDHPGDSAVSLSQFGVEAAIYSSHSNTEQVPRYRVVIPTDRVMTASEFRIVRSYVHNKLLEIQADACTKKLSQPYFVPTAHSGNEHIAINEYIEGQPLQVDEILESYEMPAAELEQATTVRDLGNGDRIVSSQYQSLLSVPGHRRERLLRLICAMFNAGKTEAEAAEGIADWDISNHIPTNGFNCPYFFDYNKPKRASWRPRHGQSQRDRAVEMAAKFVATEYRVMRRKFGGASERSGRARPIFGKTFNNNNKKGNE